MASSHARVRMSTHTHTHTHTHTLTHTHTHTHTHHHHPNRYASFGDLMQHTPMRLAPSDPLPPGVTVVAGRSAKGTVLSVDDAAREDAGETIEFRAIVTAVAGADCSRVALTVAGLGVGGVSAPQLDYTVIIINATHTNIMAVAGNAPPTSGGELTIEFDLAPPAVASVRVFGTIASVANE